MSDPKESGTRPVSESGDAKLSALFAQLVLQQANMAMMLLGKTSHPETGQVVKDLEAARLFIDELEMLEVKTRGNLSKDEGGLLKQSLMSLRMAFVEAVESPDTTAKTAGQAQPQAAEAAPESKGSEPASAPNAEEEHRKKFTKKY